MKKQIAILLSILMISLIFASCSADMEVGNNTELSEQFLTYVMREDYDAAYTLVKTTVNTTDFSNCWTMIRVLAEGAKTYDVKQIGWNVSAKNGLTTCTTAYEVYFDNGKTMLLQVVTRNDIQGIAGITFSDVTDFLNYTDSFVPFVNILLIVVSILSFAFVIWMFVDCLRRKMKLKVLWAILIFLGIAFTIASGEQTGFKFAIGLMIESNSIVADPSIMSVITKFVVPVGAILYLCLRKRLTVVPNVLADTANVAETPVIDGSLETDKIQATKVTEES